jgi:hypothetical protein
MFVAADDETGSLYLFGGTTWSERKFEATTASLGLETVGLDVRVNFESTNPTLQTNGSDELGVKVGTGLTSSATGLDIDFDTTGVKAVTAANLASNANGLGAALIGIEDAAAQFTGTTVEAGLTESLDAAQAAQADIDAHTDGGANKHDASEIDVEGTYTNISTGDLETAISDIDTDLTSKADRNLNNLTSPTSVNQHLIPDGDGTRDLGSSSIGWRNVWLASSGSGVGSLILRDTSFNNLFLLDTAITLPSGGTAGVSLEAHSAGGDFGIHTDNSAVANATPTGDLFLETGNKTAGTGNSGSIGLRTGTSSGGTRGTIDLRDGSEGTSGQIWRSTGTAGEGNWEALTATKTAYERADGSKKNIQASSDDVENALTDLDDAIGALTASPTNYTPSDATITADHLSGIDTALGS